MIHVIFMYRMFLLVFFFFVIFSLVSYKTQIAVMYPHVFDTQTSHISSILIMKIISSPLISIPRNYLSISFVSTQLSSLYYL